MLKADTHQIVKQVRTLVAIVLFSALFTLALIIWDTYETEKISDITSNYHTASSQDIRSISNAILTIKYNLKVSPDNLYTELSHDHDHGADNDGRHDITRSLYIVKQNAESFYADHKKYQYTDFDALVTQLKIHLNPIIELIDNNKIDPHQQLYNNNIKTVLLILDQLDRLHMFANQEMRQQESKNSRIRILILFTFISIALLLAFITIKRTFTSIRYILDQQIQTERTLRQEKELIHTTLLSIGDAVITTDKNGLVTNLNPVAEQLTGWTNAEAQGKTVKKIFPIFNASTRESIENPVETVIQTGETVYLSNHTTLRSKDGTEYQIADSAAPILNNNEIMGMVLVFNDVTEQYKLRASVNKSKRDMQAVMDNTPAVIYIKDIEGRYQYINKKFETLFHVHIDDIINKTDYDIFPDEIAHMFQKNDKEVIALKQTIVHEETAPHDDGLHSYNSTKYPLLREDGTVYAICGISTDITKSKEQDEFIRRSQKMDALGKLVGGVAHDYNNMLGVILGYTNLLDGMQDNSAKQKKYIHQILHAAERGSQLTKRLLSFSSSNPEDTRALNINQLITDIEGLLKKTLTPKIVIKLELDEALWPVWLDRNNLEDIILNISINAMHAINGNGSLTLRTANISANNSNNKHLPFIEKNDYVLLQISDTGCGMDAFTKEKIFDPFFTTKGEFGTGLGLSQVYGYVQQSGGTITVDSTPGEGTQFNLYFPRYTATEITKEETTIDNINSFNGNENILLVDDETALLELTSEVIEQHGYTTFCASNANEAMNILKNESIHLMLSDIIMPDIDGYQLAAFVQEHYPSVKIQLASGFSDDRHLKYTDDTLHESLLNKPYDMATVLQRIRELLDT